MDTILYQITANSTITKPSVIVLSEPQSYQLLLVGLAVFGAVMFWQNYSK